MKAKRMRTDGLKTREAILAAAAEEFSAKGFELGSMRAICERAGANAALANRYFGSKEGLYRTVAKRLFGDLGEPLTGLAEGVASSATWKRAIRAWVDGFLFMTIPTEKAQRLCAGLFRQEVTRPTRFYREFKRDFGKPVFDALRQLLAMAVSDEAALELWASSVWAQVSVYALADRKWHTSFRPEGVDVVAWRDRVGEHIAEAAFASLSFKRQASSRTLPTTMTSSISNI